MSDRYLRTLLREAQQGQVALTDYVAAALRVMPLEEVVATLRGFDTESIRLAVRLVWIPVYATRSKKNRNRVVLAEELETQSKYKGRFPLHSFFNLNRSRLTRQEWRLFAADCAEHVLHYFEDMFPLDTRPRAAIATAKRFAVGEATAQELHDAEEEGYSASRDAEEAGDSEILFAAKDSAESAAGAVSSDDLWAAFKATKAALNAALSAGIVDHVEISRLRARLADYLVGLSALPWPT